MGLFWGPPVIPPKTFAVWKPRVSALYTFRKPQAVSPSLQAIHGISGARRHVHHWGRSPGGGLFTLPETNSKRT